MRVFYSFLIVMKTCLSIFKRKLLLYFLLINKLLNNVIQINYFENLFCLDAFLLNGEQNYPVNYAGGQYQWMLFTLINDEDPRSAD
ncbi:hypothetical protein [Arsenophonus nasoniae]|uniref:Uncharacterized protein n=1 Tax=Arsenophonus nasoniae TaxID=638 RepID=A0AA95GG67_9GAMM|nr:hypothetical protein [Arsenophonus nasoniae]WGL95374.1 hypothetical protein QE207_17325 [Arsenophonus nasoniae]